MASGENLALDIGAGEMSSITGRDTRSISEQEDAGQATYTVTEPGGAVLSVHGDSDDAFWTAYDAMKSAVGRQLWRGQVLLATCVAATKHQPVDAFGSGRGKRGDR